MERETAKEIGTETGMRIAVYVCVRVPGSAIGINHLTGSVASLVAPTTTSMWPLKDVCCLVALFVHLAFGFCLCFWLCLCIPWHGTRPLQIEIEIS